MSSSETKSLRVGHMRQQTNRLRIIRDIEAIEQMEAAQGQTAALSLIRLHAQQHLFSLGGNEEDFARLWRLAFPEPTTTGAARKNTTGHKENKPQEARVRDLTWCGVPVIVQDEIPRNVFQMPLPDDDPDQQPTIFIASETADAVMQDFERYREDLELEIARWRADKHLHLAAGGQGREISERERPPVSPGPETCQWCKGSGRHHHVACGVCGGRGHVLVARPAQKCVHCSGSGQSSKYPNTVCWACGGSGWSGTARGPAERP